MAKYDEKPDMLQALKADLKAGVTQRLYFFHGDETFLLNHYLGQMRRLLLDELTESFNFHKLTAETFDLQTLADCVENLPMMAEHSLVWVDEIDIFKLPEDQREKLMDILGDIPDYCTLVFTYVTTPWHPDKRLKKLWDLVQTKGTVVEFPKQDQRDLVPWIARHFAAHKKKITTDLCVYLIEITGGTMTALAGEIAKIAAYSGSEVIVRADIDAVTEPVLDAVIFQMTDAMSQGDYGAALLKLRQLLKMQQEPLSVLGGIGAHFRRLAAAKSLSECGKGPNEYRQLYPGSKDFMVRKTMATAARFSGDFYRRAAQIILETDRRIKTSFDDTERLLELVILQLSQEARHG